MPRKKPAKSKRKGSVRRGSTSQGGKAKPQAGRADSTPRIIGGRFRGKKLVYSGDVRTRPMKERVREATFNLVGPVPKTMLAIDLFAGTGALGLEALSRGARDAILIERHFPTSKIIQENCESLGVADHCIVLSCDAFHWVNYRLDTATVEQPWLVFVSPPYAFYQDRRADMLQLIETFQDRAPVGSMIVAEFDAEFDAELLPTPGEWDARPYAPAIVAIWRKKPT